MDLGEFENAESDAKKALDTAQKFGEKAYEGSSWIAMGRVLGKKAPEGIKRAEEHILGGIKILEKLECKPFVSRGYFCLGELYANTGKQDKAQENLEKAEAMFREMDMDYYLTKTQEVLERVGRSG